MTVSDVDVLSVKLSNLKRLGASEALCGRIDEYIRTGVPGALVRISPFRLADQWELDRDEVLEAFLHATRLGIFDLEWAIRCPSCTGGTQLADELRMLLSDSHCDYCRIEFEGGFDDAVEVTFRVNPNVREVGELSKPEIMMCRNELEPPLAAVVEAGGEWSQRVDLVPGTYHFFSEGLTMSAPLLVRGEPQSEVQEVRYTCDGASVSRGNRPRTPGPYDVRVRNTGAEAVTLYLARARELPWVSGAHLASTQSFRDLFSKELIDPAESFSVKSSTFVFTDIRGSTELYERLGDSEAYALVREHFKIITDVIRRHRGAVVKTIGDAVMATFMRSTDALRAVFEMHGAFDAFNEENHTKDDIVIKVGIHRGPCISVNLNDHIDYFGRTVNISARIQGLSAGNDIVLSRSLAEEPGSRDILQSSGWQIHPFSAELKGIADRFDVVHLTEG